MNYNKTRWESVDWTRPLAHIAKELGVTAAAVSHQKARRGMRTVKEAPFKPFSLSTLRSLKINPVVAIGPERLLVSSLKSRKGEEIVSVEKAEFCRAMNERAEALWSSNNNET